MAKQRPSPEATALLDRALEIYNEPVFKAIRKTVAWQEAFASLLTVAFPEQADEPFGDAVVELGFVVTCLAIAALED